MRIEPHSDWADKNGIIVKIESSFLHRDAFYVINFKYLNGEREHQSSVMPLAEFIEKYEQIKPKPKQVVVIEKWLFEDKFGIKFVQEIEKDCVLCYCNEFNTQKVKLLDTYEVEL